MLWRILGLGFAGFAGGGLISSLLYGLRRRFAEEPQWTTSQSGVFFGVGCLVATLLVNTMFFARPAGIQPLLLAAIPLYYFLSFLRRGTGEAMEEEVPPVDLRPATKLRSFSSILLGLLLFFQFGNEWSIASWLPLFLIRRLGVNPERALFTLAVFFVASLMSRLLVRRLSPSIGSRILLFGSVLLGITGCIWLSITGSTVGTYIAVVAIGFGFSAVVPLVMGSLDDRFSFQPAFYSRILAIAITGALCVSWLLSYVYAYLGVMYLVLIPAFGSIVVLILALVLRLDVHLTASRPTAP